MSIDNSLARLTIADNLPNENVFKNPSKLPINEIHMERSWRELKRNLSTGFDWEDRSEKDLEQSCFELKKEIIPALDKRWLLKLSFHKFAPVCIPQQDGENTAFLAENTLFIDSLDYLLTCDYHHFWCCILFEESATTAIRSFLLKPVLPFEANYLEGEYMEVYKTVFNKFLLVYKKLLTFKQSETEYMSQSFGLAKLKERKLINLPIVITLAVLYQDSDLEFVNETVDIYFNDATEVEYLTKEVDFFIEQNLIKKTIESVFKEFIPVVPEEPEEDIAQPGPSRGLTELPESEIDQKIQSIMDMFPHLGDGFVLQCLESYNFNTTDVINAILEDNLPPHLSEIPFDGIRIPAEPEPEKPVLAYTGKKPEYDDALKLLNDKTDIKAIKNLVLEGIQYNYEHMYDDEYDDRFNDDVAIPVADNPVGEELQAFNPNRQGRRKESESEDEESEEETNEHSADRNRFNFCEDPAVIRARREARYRTGQAGASGSTSQLKPKGDVVGKPKGQGQDKNTLLNRQKKAANKSSRANHNRKGGAQWKRTRGMVPS
ncbi:hypothetical protein YQE_07009, partial [Dendroctonus ponderosae]